MIKKCTVVLGVKCIEREENKLAVVEKEVLWEKPLVRLRPVIREYCARDAQQIILGKNGISWKSGLRFSEWFFSLT